MKKALGTMLILIVSLVLVGCSAGRQTATGLGSVTFELFNQNDELIKTRTVEFVEGDTLLGLLQQNFTVYCPTAEGTSSTACDYTPTWGIFLTGLDDIHAFDSSIEYLAFYINGEYATTGVDGAMIVDGYVYTFKHVLL
jgi:hypothetical protein